MRVFANLPVAIKLIAAFLLTSALAALLGLFAVAQLEKVNATATELETSWLPSVRAMSSMHTNFVVYRAKELQHIISTSDADMAKYDKQIAELIAQFARETAEYQKLISTEEERAKFDEIQVLWKQYLVESEAVTALSRAPGKKAEATEAVRAKSMELYLALAQAYADIVALNGRGGEAAAERGNAIYATSRQQMVTGLVAIAVIGLLLGWMISRTITKPLQEAVTAANAVASGDMTVKIAAQSKDEVGQLSQALANMVERLTQTVAEVRASADGLASASEQMSATSQAMSQASTEQASSVEETSASVEEMTASINQNTDNAKITDQMASKAAQEAREGGDAVGKTVEAMKQIAQKISIIDDIAYQTNLLALNAAIEAARAGEHGKGFAVVAAEVRKLAERSQIAAQEIGEVAGSSVQLAEHAGQLLGEIVPAIRKTSDLVQEIAAASKEQSSGVGQINSAMNQLSQLTQQNASSSEELAATAEEMSSQAQQLQSAIAFFKVEGAGPAQAAKRAAPPRVRHSTPPVLRSPGNGKANGKSNGEDHGIAIAEQQFVRF